MKTEAGLCHKKQVYDAPSAEIFWVAIEEGFARSGKLEDVGKDDEIEFY